MTTAHVGHRLTVADVRPRARIWPDVTRVWAALSGLGFGVVALGIGAGHLAHHLPVGLALVAIGAATVGWAVLALRGPLPTTRAALLSLVVLAPLVLLSAPATGVLPSAAEAAALTLGLLTAVLIGLHSRTTDADSAHAGSTARLDRRGTGGDQGPGDVAATPRTPTAPQPAPSQPAPSQPAPSQPAPAGRQALAMFLGAMVIAAVTVPGLAATEAGAHAVPHGSHGLPAEQHHH